MGPDYNAIKALLAIVRIWAFTLGQWNWEAIAGLRDKWFMPAMMLENRL